MKKLIVLVWAAVLSLMLAAAIVWFLALPEYRPALREGEAYGIDVSAHQKSLDWQRVRADDIAFVYVKASEGSGTQDERFREHWKGASAAGLKTGAYHYFSLCSAGKTQADNFVRVVKDKALQLPPVLDLEFSPFCLEQPDRQTVLQEVADYIETVEAATDQQVILYVGDDFEETYQVETSEQGRDRKYWQLSYMRRPHDDKVRIWQVGYFFRVDGAPGKVDLNLGRIDDL